MTAGFDILTMVSFAIAAFFAMKAHQTSLSKASRNFALSFLIIYIFVGLSNFLEHTSIPFNFSLIEDYAKLLFIPLFLFFLYSLLVDREIGQRRRAESKLLSMSITDDLTGLYNRRGFFTLAEKALETSKRNSRPVALIFADLDRLKHINDTLGHSAGDSAIKAAAEVLKGTFRGADIIARLGGDEFVVLITEGEEAGSTNAVIARFKAHLQAYNQVFSDKGYELSLSVGAVECHDRKPCAIDELLKQADKLMYQHKHKHNHVESS